jgi:CBS domain-containing protein
MQTAKHLIERKGNQIISVAPTDTVLRAIEVMADKHVGALLVMDQGRLVGVISERDYARKVILKGRLSNETRVSEIMSSPVVSVGLDDTVHRCMEIMTEKHIRHLAVMRAERVMGVLSIGDLVKALLDSQREEIEQLQRYIAG